MRRISIHQARAGKSGARYALSPSAPRVKPLLVAPLRIRSCFVWASQQMFEKIFEATGLLCQVEMADHISSARERILLPQFAVVHQAEDRVSQRRGVSLGYQQTRFAIFHRLRDST